MGASCAKGSKTTDPDKTPYQPADKKKDKHGKHGSGRSAEPEKAAAVEQRGSSPEERESAQDERRPPQRIEEPEEVQKKSRTKVEDARPGRISDQPDQPRPARTSSSEAIPSKSHQASEKRRDSKERQEHPHPEAELISEKPKPKKRTSKEEKPLLETNIDFESSLETPKAAGRASSESEEALKRKERTSHSKRPEEMKKQVDMQSATERKRSSLDNEFVVPVKVETKTDVVTSGMSKAQTKEHEQESADKNRKSGKEAAMGSHSKMGIEEEKWSPPGGVKESDIKVKIEEGHERTPLSAGLKVSETRVSRTEEVRTEEKSLVLQSDGSKPNKEILVQKKEDLSASKRTRQSDFDIPPSGLTPVKARTGEPPSHVKPTGTPNDVIVTSHYSITSSRLSQKEGDGIRKPTSPTKLLSTEGKGEPTMAIFDALKGLKSQKGDQQKPMTETSSPEATQATSQRISTIAHPTSAAVSSAPPAASSVAISVPATATVSSKTTEGHSQTPAVDSHKPVPAVRTTLLQQSHPATEPNEVHEDRRISTNGNDPASAWKDDATKSKQERISKLPKKGAGSSSPVTSPAVSSPAASANLSPAPPASPLTPLESKTIEATDERQKTESSATGKSSKSLGGKSETKKLLLDLSRENEVLTSAYHICSNTRTKLLQAIDRWLSGNDKDKENASRVMAISGRPGIGKTCLAAELCRRYKDQLAGAHFFQFCPSRLDQNFASTLLLSVAWKLTEVLPGYSAHLPFPEELQPLLAEGQLVSLFDALISSPLQKLNSDKHLLIIIDAVDECYPSDRDHLLQVINGFEAKTPDWLYLFCTVRDDNQVTGQLDHVHVIEVKGTSEAMTADIKRYLRDPMARLIDRISLDGALTQLTNHSQGSFLAAYLLKKKLENFPEGTALALRDVTLFPTGLVDICKEFFQRFHDQLSKKFSPKEVPGIYGGVLGILVTAKEKLNTAFVKQVHASLNPDEDLVPLQGLLDTDENLSVGFHHKSISEWLHSDQAAAPLAVNITNARQKMADVMLIWLAPILEDSSTAIVPAQLQQYALKHAMEHLTDVPKQQDNIAGLLCSLSFVEKKLKVPGVTLTHLLRDYRHSHYQMTGTASKLITLDGYIKRFSNLTEQIEAYHGFVQRDGNQISCYPEFLLQFAANYPTVTRIQQNARIDLSNKPWLEDITANAETPSIVRPVVGHICQSDISNDNRTVAVLTQNEQNVYLCVLNVVSGELQGDPFDLSNIPDRKGLCVKFLQDNNLLFVGSLSTFVFIKNGKPTPSGLDVQSVQVKERYTVECCDIANGYLACGINTLPWGGRSLHMIIFDLKSKSAKTLEVLKFRFGGSAQFGIKACALSSDGSLLSACSKQTNKNEMKVIVYNTGNLNSLYSIDIENDMILRCFFIGNLSLIMCGGTGTPEIHQQTYLWSFQEKQAKCLATGNPENCSTAHFKNSQLTLAHHCRSSPRVMVSRWKKEAMKQESPDDRHVLHGLSELSNMFATEKSLVFLSRNVIRIFRMADFTTVEVHPTSGAFALHDSIVESLSFMPRSDEPIVVHRSATAFIREVSCSDVISASKVSVKNDGTLLGVELFTNEQVQHDVNGKELEKFRCFQGAGSAMEICSSNPDGGIVVINTGSDVKVLELASGTQRSLPKFTEISAGPSAVKDSSRFSTLICVLSSKESLAGISYPEKPESLFLFDLKSKAAEPTLELFLDASPTEQITDFAFIPNNGYVISYHKTSNQSLVVWNQRNGTQISRQTGIDVVYVRSSPSSDRLVLSLRHDGRSGSLILRNSDNRFNISLELVPSASVPEVGCGDVEFSADGTVLMGMFVDARAIRIWNGGNGEPLKDLNFGFIASTTEIVGMLTNTHALLNDGSMLYVCDVDAGDVICIIHSAQRLASKLSSRGLRISPKGGLIAGSTDKGAELRLFQCHNLSSVKRKTSLQLIRSK